MESHHAADWRVLRHLLAILAGLALAAIVGRSLRSQTYSYQPVVTTSAQCTSFAVLPDGRVLLCERLTGNVRVAVGGVVQSTPWWSVGYTATPLQESGLLSIAVDPQFITNHRVYVCLTDPPTGLVQIIRLEEVGGVGANAVAIHARTMTGNVHHSGPLAFGHDGRLYAQTGDENAGQSQTWNDPRGKILRLNTDGTAPIGNPVPGVHTWAQGLRNGYGLCFHPTLGFLYQTENGYAGGDELNVITAGADYGWPQVEGPAGNPAWTNPTIWWPLPPAFVPTGVAVLTPETRRWSAYGGHLFVAQWSGQVHRVAMDDSGLPTAAPALWWTHGPTFALRDGPDGNLWVLSTTNFGFNWEVGRYVETGGNITLPGAHIGPVSGPSIGGSVTVGLSTQNAGQFMLAWCSTNTYSPPVPSPWGAIEVPADYMFAGAVADARGNVFHALAIPNDPALAGTLIHTQGMDYDPVTGAGTVTNRATHKLR